MNEFFQVAIRKKIYKTIDELQEDLDDWIEDYNKKCTYHGKYCYGKTPYQTFLDSRDLAKEKYLDMMTRLDKKSGEPRIDFPEITPHKESRIFVEMLNSVRRNIRYN